MRLSLRFIVPLLVVLAAFAWAVVPVVDRLTLRWFMRDLDLRASLIANTLDEPLEDVIRTENRDRMLRFFTRATEDERMFAMGFCASRGSRIVATSALPEEIVCARLDSLTHPAGRLVTSAKGPVLVSVRPLVTEATPAGRLILVHDMSFIQRRSEETRGYLFYFFVGLGLTVSLITVAVAQLSWRGWVQGLRALLRGEGLLRPQDMPQSPELRPIASDLRALIRDIEVDRRERDEERLAWTPDTLRTILREDLRGQEVIVVSNREPYIHVRQGDAIAVRRPASGLVTALDPVMRACSGTWVAHGGGSADREVVDRRDRVAVPGERPAYHIRRVWLTPEEEAGYYYGFANEGLWPLCHIVHERPQFRADDWEHYRAVNARFAATLLEEMEKAESPIVLAQDYHFALLPQIIKQSRPDARVALFWHIPWPNSEAFGICPWQEEILLGLLGADLIGFHTQFHCNNFLETVERTIEGRIDWENFTVVRGQHRTWVRPFPISVAPDEAEEAIDRAALRAELGISTEWLGVGVERVDYTKGLPERFRALRRFFERWPEYRRRVTFVQIASLSRTRIPRYRALQDELREAVRSINEELGDRGWQPIVYRERHHDHNEIRRYYRAADFCMVTSLHDGMNLVAKEYVASQDDDDGSLILSRFTGASRELRDAYVVNPYDVEDMAAAIHDAITADPVERRSRMRRMREHVREYNIYGWAGLLVAELARIPQPSLERG